MPVLPGSVRSAGYLGGLDERERDEFSLLEGGAQFGLSSLATAGAILDTPAAAIRNMLGGQSPLVGLWPGDAHKRLYAKDLFERWGVKDHGGFAGEIALEMALDPLMYLSGGLSALTRSSKAGKALTKSGVLTSMKDVEHIGRRKAADLLKRTKSLIKKSDPHADWSMVHPSSYNQEFLTNFVKDFATKTDLEGKLVNPKMFAAHDVDNIDSLIQLGLDMERGGGRSSIGQRQLKRLVTPQDVLEYSTDPKGAKQKLLSYLQKKKQVPGDVPWSKVKLPFAKELADPLSAHMTFGGGLLKPLIKPFKSSGYVDINLPKLMKGGDWLGDQMRWRAPGLLAARLLSKGARGARTPEVQRLGAQITEAAEAAKSRVTQAGMDISRDLPKYSENVTERAMTSWFEIPRVTRGEVAKHRSNLAKKFNLTPDDVSLLNQHTKMVRQGLDESFDVMRKSGIDVPYLRDDWVAYHPRQIVQAAWSPTQADIVVDPLQEFFKDIGVAESRASVYRQIKGGTPQIGEILSDTKLNTILDDLSSVHLDQSELRLLHGKNPRIAEKLAQLGISAEDNSKVLSFHLRNLVRKNGGTTWHEQQIIKAFKEGGGGAEAAQKKAYAFINHNYEKTLWNNFGDVFKNTELSNVQNLPAYMRMGLKKGPAIAPGRFSATARRGGVPGNPHHAKHFADAMKDLTPAQRKSGLFAHHPLADMQTARELAVDAAASNSLVLGILGARAYPRAGVLGASATAEQTLFGATKQGKSLREVLGSLNIDINVFDDATNAVKLQPGPGGKLIERSTDHLVKLRDDILARHNPGSITPKSPISNPASLKRLLDDWFVPAHIADDLENTIKFVQNPGKSALGDLWDGYLTLTKTHLTTPWAAFAGRNWISGQIRNMMIGLYSLKSRRFAKQLMSGSTVKGAADIPGMAQHVANRGLGTLSDSTATTVLQEWISLYKLMPEEAYGYDAINERMSRTANVILKEGLEPLRQPSAFVPLEKPRVGKMFSMWMGLDEVAKKRRLALREGAKTKLGSKFAGLYLPGREFFEIEGAWGRGAKGSRFAGAGRKLETHFNPARAGKLLNQWVEGENRVSPFIKALMDGWDPAAAAKRVMGAQVDYASREFTRFERGFMQKVFPFYKFRAGQLKWLPGEIAQRPGGAIPQAIRGINTARGGRERWMPEHMLAGAALPLPSDAPLVGPPDPTTDIAAQFTGFMFTDPLDVMPGVSSDATRGILSSMHPTLKGLAELGLDESFFQSGRPLTDIKAPLRKLAQNIKGTPYADRFPGAEDIGTIGASDLAKKAEHLFITNTPIARYVNTLSQLFEPRVQMREGDYSGLLTKTLPKLIGAPHIARVSKRQRDALKRLRAEQLLKERGKAKAFERHYIPHEQQLEIHRVHGPQRLIEVLRYQEVLNRLAKELRESKIRSLGGSEAAKIKRRKLKQEIDRIKEAANISQ